VRFKVFCADKSAYIKIFPGTIILKQQSRVCTAFKVPLLTKVWHLPRNGADGKPSDESCDHKFQHVNCRCTFHLIGLHPGHSTRNVPWTCVYREQKL